MELGRPAIIFFLFLWMTSTDACSYGRAMQTIHPSLQSGQILNDHSKRTSSAADYALDYGGGSIKENQEVAFKTILTKYESAEDELRASRKLRRIIMLLGGATLVLFIYSFRKYRSYKRLNDLLSQNQQQLSDTVKDLEKEKTKYYTQYERMKQLLESISAGMWELNIETGELFMGKGVARLLGYQPKKWNIKNLKDDDIPVHPEDLPLLREAKENCLSRNCRELNLDFRILDSLKEYRWLKLRGCMIKPLDEEETHKMFGIVDDIQELKEAQAQRRQKEKALEEANKAKDKFFSIIAHDLKSPFNAILGLSDLLFQEIDNFSEEEIKEYASGINTASESAYQLLQNLLHWSRSQNGRIEFEPAYQDLNKLAGEVINVNKHRAETKQISLEMNIPAELTVFADRNMLYTVLHNLLTNAIKFTPHGKKVVVEAFKVARNTEIHVKDEGMGIPEVYVRKIFNIDNDYRRPGTDNEKGTGLGLVLCKEFVEKHDGKIWVHSKEGSGSDFAFTLPDA